MFDVGGRLKEVREDQGLTKTALAQKVGLDPSQITKIENGQSNPSLDALFRICETLNITPAEFFTIDDQQLSPDLRKLLNTSKHLTVKQLSLLSDFLETFHS